MKNNNNNNNNSGESGSVLLVSVSSCGWIHVWREDVTTTDGPAINTQLVAVATTDGARLTSLTASLITKNNLDAQDHSTEETKSDLGSNKRKLEHQEQQQTPKGTNTSAAKKIKNKSHNTKQHSDNTSSNTDKQKKKN
jgi:hypothetical protein